MDLNLDYLLWKIDFIRRECGLLRNPIDGVREASIKIIEQECEAALARFDYKATAQ